MRLRFNRCSQQALGQDRFGVLIEPGLERCQDWQAMLLTQGKSVASAVAPFRQSLLGQRLNLIQATDQVQCLSRAAIGLSMHLGRFIKVSPRM